MAELFVDGMDGVLDMFENLLDVPDRVLEQILEAQTKVVIEAQKQSVPKNKNKLEGSIKPGKILRSIDDMYRYIYPQGTHHVSKKSRYRNSGSSRTVTNAEVGFIHEFGAPRRNIKASQWMRKANEKSAAETTAAGQEVFDSWVDTL